MLVVTSFDPTAVVDAYAVIKLLSTTDPGQEIGIVVNPARDADEAQLVFAQLEVATARFLKRRITYLGFVVEDPAVREAVLVQRPIVDHLPQSPASRCFRILASRLSGMAPHDSSGLRLVTSPGATPDNGRPDIARDPAMRMTKREIDHSERDRLVVAHIGLVKALAHRLAQRLPPQVEIPELISVGVLGLIDAASRYRRRSACRSTPSRGAACRARCSTRCAISTGRRARCARCAASSTSRSRGFATNCAASRRKKRLPAP